MTAVSLEPPTFGWLKLHQIRSLHILLRPFFVMTWSLPRHQATFSRYFYNMRFTRNDKILGGPAFYTWKACLNLLHKVRKSSSNPAFPPQFLNFDGPKKTLKLLKKHFENLFWDLLTSKNLKQRKSENSF